MTELTFSPLLSIIVSAAKQCWNSLPLSGVRLKINCPTVFPLRQYFIGPFLSAESWLPVSERGSKWMAPLMHFILQGVREGGRGREMKGWSRGQKNRDDRRDRLAEKGGIKECHKDCLCARLLMFLHAVAISQQSLTFYMLRMNLFYPCGLRRPSPPPLLLNSCSLSLPPPSLPPPGCSVPQWPDIPA